VAVADEDGEGLFRKEAIDAHYGVRGEGAVLRLVPSWTRWTFGVLSAALGFALLYAIVGTVDEYASGVAIVRVQGRRELTARLPGAIASMEVKPGQRVRRGEVLVRFHGDDVELERLEHDYEMALVKVLDDPTGGAARARLIAVRDQRDAARAAVAEREIHAPVDGIVSDVRLGPGKVVEPGQTVVSLVPDDARFEAIAVLPGSYRPRLRVGMPMRLSMAGYAHSYSDVTIDTIADQAVGGEEIRRFLPKELADTLAIGDGGTFVLVTARLRAKTFEADGKALEYFDGMQGVAEARVDTKSVLVTLVPGLEALW
jgi:membrane fusion protein (multidrug efflux system)